MAHCPECDAEIEGDPFEFEEGEIIECGECGVELEVINTSPLELEPIEKQALLELSSIRTRAASLVELLEMKMMMARTPGVSHVAH